jgi:hypothetical protein
MASTYSTTLRLELIGQGEQSGTWGVTTNNNFGALVEQAITGVQTITMNNAQYILSSFDGAVDEARNAVLVVNGTNITAQNLIAPAVEKVYIINNISGNTVNIKTSSGNAVAISNSVTTQVYCDGTDFYSVAPIINNVTGDFAATGSVSAGTNVNAANNVNAAGNVNAVNGNFSGTVTASSIAGVKGIIPRYASVTSGAPSSTTNNGDTPTGHIASITPTSATSKILVLAYGQLAQTNFGFALNAYAAVVCNGRNLTGNEAVQFSTSATSGVNTAIYGTFGFNFLDSPNTTSTLNYQIYIRTDSGYVLYNDLGTSTITLLEITT